MPCKLPHLQPTTPSQENGGKEQLWRENAENQTHQMLRINGAIMKHTDSWAPPQTCQGISSKWKGLGDLTASHVLPANSFDQASFGNIEFDHWASILAAYQSHPGEARDTSCEAGPQLKHAFFTRAGSPQWGENRWRGV